jgi:hypothetical protein
MHINRPSITFLNVAVDWKSNPSIPVVSIEHLRALLSSLSEKEPGIVNLESSTKDLLQLGIGGQFACALFTTHEDKPRYLSATTKTVRAKDDVEFLCGGTPTPIAPELCLSFEEAVKIAEYFFATGNRDPDIEWIEV